VVAQAALEGAAAVVVLHAVGLEHLDLAVVELDDELDAELAVGREEELLELLRVLELVEGLVFFFYVCRVCVGRRALSVAGDGRGGGGARRAGGVFLFPLA